MQKNLTIDYDANNSSLPDISNLNASTSSLVIPQAVKTSPGKLRYKQSGNTYNSMKANNRFRSSSQIQEEEDRYKDLEFRVNTHLQKLQDYKYSITSESLTKQRVSDKKMDKLEKRLVDRIEALEFKIEKVNKSQDIRHEYAEIKRQGEKLKTLELKFISFQRDLKLKDSVPKENERILLEKLEQMETKILEGLGEDQKKIEFSWTNQALKIGELEQRLHALQESVDETAVENDK